MSGRNATDTVIPGQFALSVGRADMPTPHGWLWVQLTDIARLESGHTPSRRHPEWWDGDVPWIGIVDARDHHGQTIDDTAQHTNADGLANSAARMLPAGTVCLVRTAASIGYVTVMGRAMATSQDLVNWVCSEAVEPHYLKHLFITEYESLLRFSKGSAHKTVYYPEIKAFHVCLPPLPEQHRIVDKIDALQARSAAARAALEAIPPLLERFRQSVLAAAFRGDLTREWRAQNPDAEPVSALLERIRAERRQRWIEDYAEKARGRAAQRAAKKGQPWTAADDTWALAAARKKGAAKYEAPAPADPAGLPPLPEGWCWASAAEVVDPGTIITYGVVKPGPDIPDGTPYVRGKDVKGGTVLVDQLRRMAPELAASKPNSELRTDDVLLCIIGEFRSAVVPEGMDGANLTQGAVRMRPSTVMEGQYLYWWLSSPIAASWMEAKRFGNSITRINVGDARSLPVPIAPTQEQARVVAGIDSRLSEVASAANAGQLPSLLDRLDQSILAKAFRGELVPQDPSDEPAAALLERIRAERAAAGPNKTRGRRKAKAAPKTPPVPQPDLPGLSDD